MLIPIFWGNTYTINHKLRVYIETFPQRRHIHSQQTKQSWSLKKYSQKWDIRLHRGLSHQKHENGVHMRRTGIFAHLWRCNGWGPLEKSLTVPQRNSIPKWNISIKHQTILYTNIHNIIHSNPRCKQPKCSFNANDRECISGILSDHEEWMC